jgi:hypothetical protein
MPIFCYLMSICSNTRPLLFPLSYRVTVQWISPDRNKVELNCLLGCDVSGLVSMYITEEPVPTLFRA